MEDARTAALRLVATEVVLVRGYGGCVYRTISARMAATLHRDGLIGDYRDGGPVVLTAQGQRRWEEILAASGPEFDKPA